MRLDRRTLLASLSAVAAAGVPLGGQATPVGTIRLRRSVAGMAADDPDIEALRQAIPILRKSGAWETQVVLHADMRNRQHTSWRFLPWHRMQLARFERIVAEVSGKSDFALPYWDWGKDPFPAVFQQDPVFRQAKRTVPRGLIMEAGWFTARLDDPFATFFGAPREVADPAWPGPRYAAGSAEWSGHNLAHGYIGGDMNDLQRAPNDPVFWLHHANVDRCWAQWRRRNPDEVYPQAWRDEVLEGLVDASGARAPAVTAGSIIETQSLGYAYPRDDSLPPVLEPPPTSWPGASERQSWTARPLAKGRGVIEIPGRFVEGRSARAVGFIEMACAPHKAAMVAISARRAADGTEFFRDTMFAVPMGVCFEAAAYRISLDRIWTAAAGGVGDIAVGVDINPVRGRRIGGGGVLRRAVIDADISVRS